MSHAVDIGIVCGKCDRYSPVGVATCPECRNDLALFPEQERARAKRGAPPEVRAVAAAAAMVDEEPPPATRVDPPMMDGSADHVLEADAPPSKVFDDKLKPRRTKSDEHAVAQPEPRRPAPRHPKPIPREEPQTPVRTTTAAHASVGATPPSGGLPLKTRPTPRSIPQTPPAPSGGMSVEELMEQAKHFVCRSCSTPVPMGHKFCGRCGAAIPPEIVNARTQFFGQLQAPGKAKLILIRGEGVEGLSYQLNAEQHVVGRQGQLVFPDDPFVSPKHANLFYRNGKLVIRDEGSLNGVFLRVRGSVDIASGESFLCGEQLFKFETAPPANEGPGPDGTYFYASPKHQSSFRVTQSLQGGSLGMTVCARGTSLQIGREGGDLNFPTDLYMSATHCRIEEQAGKFTLTDLNSRNGTYIRLSAERELAHGDYLFIGRKLLRVEITAA